MRESFLSLLGCVVLCSCQSSCSSHDPYPKNNPDETKWEQQYRDGDITWAEYQQKLKDEKKK